MRTILLELLVVGGVYFLVFFLFNGGAVQLWKGTEWASRQVGSASVFFVTSITATQIQNDYHSVQATDPATGTVTPAPSKKVRILIVPGHQPDAGGTIFHSVLERDVVVAIADDLAALLAENPRYEITVARTATAWNPILQNYFDTHADAIMTFAQSQKAQMAAHIADGSITLKTDPVYHNDTSPQGTLQLYGINKWANENAYDITIHLHTNDDTDHRSGIAGEYSGFAVYVPDHQYSNAAASRAVGEAIASRLGAYHATSTLSGESAGVVEDQTLIAVGSNNSADTASVLIEYGYTYEPQFQNASVLPLAERDYAYATYLGLQDFMHDSVPTTTGSSIFPHDWSTVTVKLNEKSPGVYALQAALHYLDFYPPVGKSFSECPVSGKVGPCTQSALKAYQKANGLEATGMLGPQTRAALVDDGV